MTSLREKRAELQAAQMELAAALTEKLADAGDLLLAADLLPAEEPFASLRTQEAEQSQNDEHLADLRRRIESLTARLTELRGRREELDRSRSEAVSELDPLFEAMGKAAFRVYRENPLVDQEYTAIFAPLTENDEEIREASRELAQRESDVKAQPFLEKMVTRGKMVLLRNRIASREAAMARLYREAGQEIAGTDFLTALGDQTLHEAATPLLERSTAINRIDTESSANTEEQEKLLLELEGLGVGRRPARRLGEIDDERKAVRAARRQTLAEMARAARGLPIGGDAPRDVAEALEAVSDVSSRLEGCEAMLARVNAGIEAERVDGEIETLGQSIARKRRQIAILEEEIGTLEAQTASLEERRAEQEQIRGALSDLLE